MKTEKIVKVLKIQKHCYDGTNCEPAIYAKSDKRPGYRWYVGYGGDYLPASKADLDNIEHMPGYAPEVNYVGMSVQMYRS